MIVFNDLISGDQVLSDAFPTKPLVVGGTEIVGVVCAQSKMVTKSIGEVNTGGNASAEAGDDEAVEDKEEKVNSIKDPLIGFGYEGPNDMSSSEFMTIYKGWCKAVKEKLEKQGKKPKPFMDSAKAFLEVIKTEFKNFEIYFPKSYNQETFILGWWDEESNSIGAPKFIYFMEALVREKY